MPMVPLISLLAVALSSAALGLGLGASLVGLVGAVLYHALNGLRVILVDFWSRGPRYQRQMTWVIAGVWLVVMIPGTYYMMIHTVEALFGSTP